jgi:maltose O-acetyltransferase
MYIEKIIDIIIHRIKGDDLHTLKKNGLQIGKNVFFGSDVFIDSSFPWLISIGDECTITYGVIILAHDSSIYRHLGYTKIGKVSIGSKTFIGARSIILPGVKIGKDVIIGAGSIVTKDIPDNSIAAGNPAVVIGNVVDYTDRNRCKMATSPVYEIGWTLATNISAENKEIMKKDLEDRIGYII